MAEARQTRVPQDGFRQNVALDGPSRVQDAPPIARRGGNSATMLEQFNVMLRTMATLSSLICNKAHNAPPMARRDGNSATKLEQFNVMLRTETVIVQLSGASLVRFRS